MGDTGRVVKLLERIEQRLAGIEDELLTDEEAAAFLKAKRSYLYAKTCRIKLIRAGAEMMILPGVGNGARERRRWRKSSLLKLAEGMNGNGRSVAGL